MKDAEKAAEKAIAKEAKAAERAAAKAEKDAQKTAERAAAKAAKDAQKAAAKAAAKPEKQGASVAKAQKRGGKVCPRPNLKHNLRCKLINAHLNRTVKCGIPIPASKLSPPTLTPVQPLGQPTVPQLRTVMPQSTPPAVVTSPRSASSTNLRSISPSKPSNGTPTDS